MTVKRMRQTQLNSEEPIYLLENCQRCGQALIALPWSFSHDESYRQYIKVCNNLDCPCYRNPGEVFVALASHPFDSNTK